MVETLDRIPTITNFEIKMDKLCVALLNSNKTDQDFQRRLKVVVQSVATQCNQKTPVHLFTLREVSSMARCKENGILRELTECCVRAFIMDPHIRILRNNETVAFGVFLDNVELFNTESLKETFEYYFSMCYAANVEYPKNSQFLAHILENYLMEYSHGTSRIQLKKNLLQSTYIPLINATREVPDKIVLLDYLRDKLREL